jgi:1-deoxy-D-xylulose-5-phosphate synthase
LLVLEDSFGEGCVGQRIASLLTQQGKAPQQLFLKNLGKTFAPEGSVAELEHSFGLDAAGVAETVREALHGK